MEDFVVSSLLEMGFSKGRIELAIARTKSRDLQLLMDWLICHAEELDVASFAGEAGPSTSSMMTSSAQTGTTGPSNTFEGSETTETYEVTARAGALTLEKPYEQSEETPKLAATGARSATCEDCGNGQIFETSEEIEVHTEKSGHKNFTEFKEKKKQLTDEEKKKRKG